MKLRTGEKWYGGIVLAFIIGMGIGLICREKGFEAVINGKPTTVSKTNSFLLIVLLPTALGSLIFGALGRGLLKTNDFICKYCKKEYGSSFETEKNVCKTCYEKRSKKGFW